MVNPSPQNLSFMINSFSNQIKKMQMPISIPLQADSFIVCYINGKTYQKIHAKRDTVK